MDAETIVENMKAVLKRTKRRKSLNKKHSSDKNKSEASTNNDDDKEISELMTKNWQMKTPPVIKKEINGEIKEGTEKVLKKEMNAFEKLMSRRSNPDITSQNQKCEVTPELNITNCDQKIKRKYTKKNKTIVTNGIKKLDNSILDEESLLNSSECNEEIINENAKSPNAEGFKTDSTKKRTRASDACLENSSKKRKMKDCKMQLDSNENSIENNEIENDHQTERPKRSCVSKINYALIAGSPSPEKKTARHKPEPKVITKILVPDENSPVKDTKENIKLAPLFVKKTKKLTTETVLQESNVKTEIAEEKLPESIEKPCEIIKDIKQENNQSTRPRRSCAGKTDYSLFNRSPEKRSPEKKPLRPRSDIENVAVNEEINVPRVITNQESVPVFGSKSKILADKIKGKTKAPSIEINSTESNEKTPEKIDAPKQETPHSGRPRRSCTSNKIDYSQLFGSPDKKSPEKKINAKQKTQIDPELIIIDENSPDKKTKGNVKLAPLFVKKIPKPAIDPAILEARRNFLLSELPANLRAPIDKQRQFEDEILSNEMVAYPLVSHITQLQDDDQLYYDIHHNSKVKIIEEESNDITTVNLVMKCGILTDCTNQDYASPVMNRRDVQNDKLQPMLDIKEAVRKIKDNSGNFPVNRCFKQILNKLKYAREDDDGNDNGISQLNSSFVELFKPSSFEEILIGLEPVKSLQEFLNTWNDRNAKYDNYESDDSNSRHSTRSLNNCVVLSGKNGSGKTSSVYALANDLNYEVIEINAGSRRSGKKILQDLLEATQSHRVEKNLMDDETSSDNFQNDVVDKKTIILIEDAELTFENDDGFISSIQQLINISKRPVILTTNDSNCQHLQKFIQHNEIIYDSPKNFVTKYLSLISIATANYQIDEAEIENLYSFNGYDLRKTINEIEFFIRSETAGVNSGSLMGLFCDTKNKNRLQKGSQLAFHSQRDLSTLRSRSSIISDYSAMLSCSQRVFEGGEVSYHQHNLMNEMANFFEQSNLLKMEYQNELTRKEREQIISRSISSEICLLNASTRAKNVDYSPLLRHICRSEKTRDISRRTNRSHYLRYHLPNALNTNEYFNMQCSIFQEDDV